MEGTPFGRYRLVEILGRGGMGEVWKAFDTAMNRVVALKVLPANLADDAQYQARFRREAQAAASLDEPHIVPIHDFGEVDGRLYVTMRLIDGKTINELVDNGPLAPQRAVPIIEQIAAALGAAHRIGLVHRDVKPSNILVTEDDFAYLIDFGIARAAEATMRSPPPRSIGRRLRTVGQHRSLTPTRGRAHRRWTQPPNTAHLPDPRRGLRPPCRIPNKRRLHLRGGTTPPSGFWRPLRPSSLSSSPSSLSLSGLTGVRAIAESRRLNPANSGFRRRRARSRPRRALTRPRRSQPPPPPHRRDRQSCIRPTG